MQLPLQSAPVLQDRRLTSHVQAISVRQNVLELCRICGKACWRCKQRGISLTPWAGPLRCSKQNPSVFLDKLKTCTLQQTGTVLWSFLYCHTQSSHSSCSCSSVKFHIVWTIHLVSQVVRLSVLLQLYHASSETAQCVTFIHDARHLSMLGLSAFMCPSYISRART